MDATTITITTSHSRHATSSLMEAVVEPGNMQTAYKRVMRNKGTGGIGKMQEDLTAHFRTTWATIRKHLLYWTYRPQPVRKLEMPKAQLGRPSAGHPDGLGPAHPAGDPASPDTAI